MRAGTFTFILDLSSGGAHPLRTFFIWYNGFANGGTQLGAYLYNRPYKPWIMKRRLTIIAASIIVLITTAIITAAVQNYRQTQQIRSLEHQKTETQKALDHTEDQLNNTQELQQKTEAERQQLQQKSQDQEKQIQDLNTQLQAKKERQESIARAAVNNLTLTARASAAPSVVPNCGDNFYANYIYTRESGCNLNAVNPGGCRGIGQACPGSKLPCGADYACQNAFFTNYAMQRYGSWEAAYSFWLKNHWW